MSTSLRSILFVSASVAALLAVAPANAQATADQGNSSEVETVVVTGTSLHGVAPAGAETLNLTSEDITATGATSVQALLADIPQLPSFGSTPFAGIGGTQLTVNRINLRNLGTPGQLADESPTLVLIDGHRFVGDGVNSTIPDPGVIPLGMIDHVEVVLDGGSAVYGADALGGVINFVTKKDFDGFEVDGSHGFGDSYSTNNLNVLAGRSWNGGSAYIGYTYAYNSAIDAADRSYEKQLSYATGVGLPFGLACNPGNVVAGGKDYAITNPTTLTPEAAGTGNICDGSKAGQLFPEEIRHAVMAGFDQDITDALKFEVTGFYSTRFDAISGGAPGFTVSEQNNNPNYVSTGGGSMVSQQVSGTFNAWTGNYVPTLTRLSTWGVTPKLTWKIGDDWVMDAYYNAGSSTTTVNSPAVNSVDIQNATTAGTFNPYNPGLASNAAAVAQALNYEAYGLGVSGLENAKVVFDGPVVSLPGGDLRLAVGSEYIAESFHGDSGGGNGVADTYQSAPNTTLHPLIYYHRHEKSVFGELNLPVIGPGNALWFLQSLSFSAAARYDDYSDFGDKLTPSFGFSAKPVDWITLRGKYNKAFQAPSPAQLAAATPAAEFVSLGIINAVPELANPAFPNPTAGFIVITGTSKGLKPQHAQTKDLGFDISPPWVSGLTLHLTYYDIEYGGLIGSPPLGSSTNFFQVFKNDYVMFPSIAAATAYLQANHATAASSAQSLTNAQAQQGTSAYPLYYVASVLAANLANQVASGFDLGFDYAHPVWFGTVFAGMNGTYQENFQILNPGLPAPNGVGSQASGGPVQRFNYTANVGATVGDNFTGQIKWNHVDGFSLSPSPPVGMGQSTIGSYNTFDLYAQYTLDRDTLSTLSDKLPPITLSLSVTNIFDTNPPHYFATGASEAGAVLGFGYADSNLGRVVQLGASVKF